MTLKLAVPPIAPAELVAASTMPETWQAAFIYLTDRFMKVIGRQAGDIKTLTTALEDARGVIAAGDRARADLLARFDEMSTRIDTVAGSVDSVRDSFSSSLAATAKTVSDQLTERVDAVSAVISSTGARLDSTDDALAALAGRVKTVDDTVKTTGEAVTRIEDSAAATARRVGEIENTVEALGTLADTLDGTITTTGERVDLVVKRADAFDVRFDGLDPRLTEIADVLAQAGERLTAVEQHGTAIAAAGERLTAVEQHGETVAGKLDTLSALVEQEGRARAAAVAGAVETVAGKLDTLSAVVEQEGRARAAAVAAVARRVEEYAESASQADGDLDDKLVKLTSATAKDVETILGRMEHYDGEIGDRFDREAKARAAAVAEITHGIEEDRARLGKIEDGVEAFIRVTTAAGAEIKTFDVRLTRIEAEATDACRRVTIALGEMPAAMMINRAGHLVRVSRTGDEVDLGCVIADGKDAADIVSARIEKGRLVFTRSDRTEFGCELPIVEPPAPATPAPTVDPGALGYVSKDPNVRAAQIEIMHEMRAEKKTYQKIADKFGTSARQVVRLLKGDSA